MSSQVFICPRGGDVVKGVVNTSLDPEPGLSPPGRDSHWSGRYTSYWNVFLFLKGFGLFLFHHRLHVCWEQMYAINEKCLRMNLELCSFTSSCTLSHDVPLMEHVSVCQLLWWIFLEVYLSSLVPAQFIHVHNRHIYFDFVSHFN